MSDSYALNALGAQYGFIAGKQTSESQMFRILLCDAANEKWDEIDRVLAEKWRDAGNGNDVASQQRIWTISSCFNRLEGILTQVARMKQHHDSFFETAKNNVGLLQVGAHFAIRGSMACSDFESLLLHTRAALDQLTLIVTSEFKQSTDRFSKLTNVLDKFAKDHRALAIKQMIEQAGSFDGIVTGKSFRSYVAHRGTNAQVMNNCFGATKIDEQSVLLFDCEARGNPLLKTTIKVTGQAVRVILNIVAVLLGVEVTRSESYICGWNNQFIVLSEYISSSDDAIKMGVVSRMTPDGVMLTDLLVDKQILSKKIIVASTKDER